MPLLLVSRASDNARQLVPPSFVDVCRKLGATIEQVSRKYLLVLKGNEDVLVPWSASKEFVERLPRDKVTVKGYDGVGHAVTGNMIADTANWIREIRVVRASV